MKQVNKEHYTFEKYLGKDRWNSIWHQISEVINANAKNVLEVGPGPGIFKSVLTNNGINVETVDVDPELLPDYVASATNLPFYEDSYDCVCAFQMLEHLPYDQALIAFKEMVRISSKTVIISLPNAEVMWPFSFHIPTRGSVRFLIKNPFRRAKIHSFDGEHYWELNKVDYSESRVVSDLLKLNVVLQKSYRVYEKPYHHFYIFEKTGA